jgi:hypothetical protein
VRLAKGKEKRSTRKVAKMLAADGINLSHESVRPTLRGQGLVPHRQVQRPRLTEEHRLRRLKFAQDYLAHDWRHTLFTDEKHFTTFSPPNPRNDVIWDVRGEQYFFKYCTVSKLTKEYLSSKEINTFETPAKSPDLAPIEKIWNTL